MSIKPELISPLPMDAGAASAFADLGRRTRSLEGHYGVFGKGMTITDATVQSGAGGRVLLANSGARGAGLYVLTASGTTAIFATSPDGASPSVGVCDNGGVPQITLTQGQGIALNSGNGTINQLSWYNNGILTGAVTSNSDGQTYIQAGSSTAILSEDDLHVTVGTETATLLDSDGSATWPGDLNATAFNVVTSLARSPLEHMGDLIHRVRAVVDGDGNIGLNFDDVSSEMPEVVKEVPRPRKREDVDDAMRMVGREGTDTHVDMHALMTLMVQEIQRLHRRVNELEERAAGASP